MTKKAFSFSTIGIAITLALALIAELWRFNGILLIDLWTPIFTFAWLANKFFKHKFFATSQKPNLKLPLIAFPAGLFVLIGFASLLIHSADLSTTEFIESTFYCIRWISMFILGLIVIHEPKRQKVIILWLVFAFALALSIAGFIQMHFLPVFHNTTYELDLGWDPHTGRLLSTWFDPNFVGGFLAFTITLLTGTALHKAAWRKYLIPIGIVLLIALALTLSRSSYLALLTGLFILGLLKSRKLLAGAIVVLIIATITITPVQNRVESLIQSAESVFTEDYTIPDQSSRLRFESWQIGWELFTDKPILGHGYNRYKHAALDTKLITDLEKHSSSGSDSSLLTILATTGIIGFIPFFTVYIILALTAWRYRKHAYAAAFFGALIGVFIHSIFVNSLLFPLFMVPFWLAAGLLPIKEYTSRH